MPAFLVSLFLVFGILTGDIGYLYANEVPAETEIHKAPITISLDQAIEHMKKKNPDIRLQEVAVEKATQEVKLATRAFWPDIDVDYIASSSSGGFGLILTAAKLFQPIFSFKKLMTEKEVKNILKEKEKILVRDRELEVEYSVKELYVTLLIQRKLARILDENAARSSARFELKKIHHKEGGLNDEELLKEKLAYETARTQSEKARTWLRQTEFAFERLLGLQPGEPFSLEPIPFSDSEVFPLNIEECLAVAYARNAYVQALLLEEKASRKKLGIKDPKFRVDGAFIGLGESSGGLLSGRPRFGVTGNFVLYDWGKSRLHKNILGLEDTELSLKHEKEFQAFEAAIVKSYFDLQRLRTEIVESGTKAELFEESKRRGKILRGIGRVRQTDLLSLENEYALQKTEDWQKHLEYFLVREKLVKYLGLSSLDELQKGITTR